MQVGDSRDVGLSSCRSIPLYGRSDTPGRMEIAATPRRDLTTLMARMGCETASAEASAIHC